MTTTTDLQKLLAEATKGPWRVEENTTWIWGNCIPEDNSSRGMGFPVAEAVLRNYGWNRDAISPEIAQANARLIAMAPDLAARVLELEAENKMLREGSRIYGLPEIPEGFGPDVHWGVPPLGESVCLSHWNRKTWFTPAVKFTDFYLHARKARAALKGGEI
jgi:hypothetical protein